MPRGVLRRACGVPDLGICADAVAGDAGRGRRSAVRPYTDEEKTVRLRTEGERGNRDACRRGGSRTRRARRPVVYEGNSHGLRHLNRQYADQSAPRDRHGCPDSSSGAQRKPRLGPRLRSLYAVPSDVNSSDPGEAYPLDPGDSPVRRTLRRELHRHTIGPVRRSRGRLPGEDHPDLRVAIRNCEWAERTRSGRKVDRPLVEVHFNASRRNSLKRPAVCPHPGTSSASVHPRQAPGFLNCSRLHRLGVRLCPWRMSMFGTADRHSSLG